MRQEKTLRLFCFKPSGLQAFSFLPLLLPPSLVLSDIQCDLPPQGDLHDRAQFEDRVASRGYRGPDVGGCRRSRGRIVRACSASRARRWGCPARQLPEYFAVGVGQGPARERRRATRCTVSDRLSAARGAAHRRVGDHRARRGEHHAHVRRRGLRSRRAVQRLGRDSLRADLSSVAQVQQPGPHSRWTAGGSAGAGACHPVGTRSQPHRLHRILGRFEHGPARSSLRRCSWRSECRRSDRSRERTARLPRARLRRRKRDARRVAEGLSTDVPALGGCATPAHRSATRSSSWI